MKWLKVPEINWKKHDAALMAMRDVEDAAIFRSLSPESFWVEKLDVGASVFLDEMRRTALVTKKWSSGPGGHPNTGVIRLRYDNGSEYFYGGDEYDWTVTRDGNGLDGRRIMSPVALPSGVYLYAREIDASEINVMVMIEAGQDLKDVVTLLADPMNVEGANPGDILWTAKGHSGDCDAWVDLVYRSPGREGSPAQLSFMLYLKTEYSGPMHRWDVSRFARDGFLVFKHGRVMVVVCSGPCDVGTKWVILP